MSLFSQQSIIKDKSQLVTSSVDIWKEQLEEINNNINHIKDKPIKSKTIRQYKELLGEFQSIDNTISPVYSVRNSIN